jgi:hypothetical protein
MLPVNMYTYYLDVAQANASGTPTWSLLHDYKTEYGLTDLSPQSMLELSERMKTDVDLANQFTWNSYGRASEKPTSVDQLELYCRTASSEMW